MPSGAGDAGAVQGVPSASVSCSLVPEAKSALPSPFTSPMTEMKKPNWALAWISGAVIWYGDLGALELLERPADRRSPSAHELREQPVGQRQRQHHSLRVHPPEAVGQVPEQEVESLFEVWDLDDGQA